MDYKEVIYCQNTFTKGKTDFYGPNSPLSFRQQKEFLYQYLDFCKKSYGSNCLYEKAVSQEQLIKNCQNITKAEKIFSAYKRKQVSTYKGWQFYTDRVYLKENTLILADGNQFPVPCAKYEFQDKLNTIRLQINIDGSYYHKSAEGILPTTTGRWVELRCGCTELIKLYFSPDGQIIVKDGRAKKYHYELHKIGDFSFDEWFEVEISLSDRSFIITYQDSTQQFFFNAEGEPNTLFFSGGMQPVGGWQVRPTFLFEGREETFVPCNKQDNAEKYIGEVSLPYAIGTEKNKDEILILKRSFVASQDKTYTMEVGALDPGGNVYVNGKLVLHTDTFQPLWLNITPYVKDGENELTLEVFPRAPEVLYPWHRHDDYYNGWFTLEVKIHEGYALKSGELNAYATKIDEYSSITVEWDSGVQKKDCFYRIALKQSYPTESEWTLLQEEPFTGKIHKNFQIAIIPWSVENPVLYTLCIEIFDKDGKILTSEVETGFRTVEQQNGAIYLNGKKTVLKGALNMQFLPPYENIPVNHLCPTDEQIVEQVLAIKNMNGNCMRMHQLGYGCNDKRFARICDRLGILLIWTTRLIDSAENMMWTKEWEQKRLYQEQMRYVLNHPSIIIWEGSNELHTDRKTLDRVYDEFVTAVKEIDETRLLSPVSHLYYGGGIYDYGCEYYDTAGERDELLRPAKSSFGWKDDSVVRSAHTYDLLLGYGAPWQDMVKQSWRLQPELFEDAKKAYLVSEYAIIGRQNPETEEAKIFINKDSYELPNEASALGECFRDDEWELSQAFQALCCNVATKQLLRYDADGMLWCCLWGGANNASYLKPIVDFYGYKKLAYYSLKQAFQELVAFNERPDVLWGKNYEIKPMACGLSYGKKYSLTITVISENQEIIAEKIYPAFTAKGERQSFEGWNPKLDDGYYIIQYQIEEQ